MGCGSCSSHELLQRLWVKRDLRRRLEEASLEIVSACRTEQASSHAYIEIWFLDILQKDGDRTLTRLVMIDVANTM